MFHRLRRGSSPDTEQRWGTLENLASLLYGGHQYPLLNTTWGTQSDREEPSGFDGYAERLLCANPVVFAATQIRLAVFSQARFVWQRRENGKVAATFTDRGLAPLQQPWPGGTSSDLLGRMELHNTVGGNAFVLRPGTPRVHMMRPDRVTIIMGSQLDVDNPADAEDATVVGYGYKPDNGDLRIYTPDEVAHYAPTPDPRATFRGMSWLTPVVRDIEGDNAAAAHKDKFFTNAATPNLLVKFDMAVDRERVEAFKAMFEDEHRGFANAYKTLFLGGGADATLLGRDMQQMDFSNTQGKGETRILMAAGVHPVIAGASEGLSGSSLNAGNFNSAKRSMSDIHLQHMWTSAVSALGSIVQPSTNGGSAVELWFDKSEIPFLQDDLKDVADIQAKKAAALRQLTDAGFTPDSARDAVNNDDFSVLVHSGLFSVQLQAPGATDDEGAPDV